MESILGRAMADSAERTIYSGILKWPPNPSRIPPRSGRLLSSVRFPSGKRIRQNSPRSKSEPFSFRETMMATGPGPMVVTTPLGKDVFSLVGFMGQEAISQPFHYQLDVTADNSKEVAFDKLLGQKVTVQI